MEQVVNIAYPARSVTFVEASICDPNTIAYGYYSWDAYFTRRFRPCIRLVASPDDARLIANICESSPYIIAHKVPLQAQISITEQPYSLLDMLNNDPLAPLFSHGTIYQTFPSALSYHRWHAQVTGTIVKTVHIPDTYYLQNKHTGFANTDPLTSTAVPDPAAPNTSQAYLCQMATRALISHRSG